MKLKESNSRVKQSNKWEIFSLRPDQVYFQPVQTNTRKTQHKRHVIYICTKTHVLGVEWRQLSDKDAQPTNSCIQIDATGRCYSYHTKSNNETKSEITRGSGPLPTNIVDRHQWWGIMDWRYYLKNEHCLKKRRGRYDEWIEQPPNRMNGRLVERLNRYYIYWGCWHKTSLMASPSGSQAPRLLGRWRRTLLGDCELECERAGQ